MAVVTLHTFGMPHDDDLELDRQIDEEMAKPMACPPMVHGVRRCPYFRCSSHMGMDVTGAGAGTLIHKTVTLRPSATWAEEQAFYRLLAEWLVTVDGNRVCNLDIADQHPDGMTLQAVAEEFGLVRERIRQIESEGLLKLRGRVDARQFRALSEALGIDNRDAIALARRARAARKDTTTKQPERRRRYQRPSALQVIA